MLNTRLNIYFAVGMVRKYQLNQRSFNLVGVKHILKYLRRMRDYMLVHKSEVLWLLDVQILTNSLIVIHEVGLQVMCSS